MRSPVILILTFLTWFSYGTIIQSGAHAQGLVITSPRNGAVLPMQQQAVIEAEFKPPVDLVFTGIQARIEAAGGATNLVIAEGDLRTISSPDRLRASWNVAEVVPGDYVITVTATAGGRTGKDTVKVTVHPIPVVSLRVTSLQNVAGGTRVTFSAIAQSPVGSAIQEFIWTPGDGSRPARTTTGSFSHIYPARGTEFIVWLQVNDALGASTLIARDLNLPRGPTQNGGSTPCGPTIY
jgi:PKD domain